MIEINYMKKSYVLDEVEHYEISFNYRKREYIATLVHFEDTVMVIAIVNEKGSRVKLKYAYEIREELKEYFLIQSKMGI